MPRVVKFMKTESRVMVARGWGAEGMGSYCLTGTESPFGRMETFQRWTVVMVAQ